MNGYRGLLLFKSLTKRQYGPSAKNFGNEGGVAPNIDSVEDTIDRIIGAINECGHEGKAKMVLLPCFIKMESMT